MCVQTHSYAYNATEFLAEKGISVQNRALYFSGLAQPDFFIP